MARSARHAATTSSRGVPRDRKSTRLNSSHVSISYAVFCLKKKKVRGRFRHLLQLRKTSQWNSATYSLLDRRIGNQSRRSSFVMLGPASYRLDLGMVGVPFV